MLTRNCGNKTVNKNQRLSDICLNETRTSFTRFFFVFLIVIWQIVLVISWQSKIDNNEFVVIHFKKTIIKLKILVRYQRYNYNQLIQLCENSVSIEINGNKWTEWWYNIHYCKWVYIEIKLNEKNNNNKQMLKTKFEYNFEFFEF